MLQLFPLPWNPFLNLQNENEKKITYKSYKEEKYLKASAKRGDTINVTITDRAHCYHQEINTVPIAQFLTIVKVRRISRILQLSYGLFQLLKIEKKWKEQFKIWCLKRTNVIINIIVATILSLSGEFPNFFYL